MIEGVLCFLLFGLPFGLLGGLAVIFIADLYSKTMAERAELKEKERARRRE